MHLKIRRRNIFIRNKEYNILYFLYIKNLFNPWEDKKVKKSLDTDLNKNFKGGFNKKIEKCNFIRLFLAAAAASAFLSACSSSGSPANSSSQAAPGAASGGAAVTEKDGYKYVSPQDAIDAAKKSDVHVIDVRDWKEYSKGRLQNSLWNPIFPLEDESLTQSLKKYAQDNLNDGKDIYIICNSGQRGAQKATGVFKDAGIDESKIFTVEGGAKALSGIKDAFTTSRIDEGIDWKYTDGKDVLELKDAQIVDVRDPQTYADGHLEGSLNASLKEFDDTAAQTAFYEFSKSKLDPQKPVYLLCYSGNKCAKTGISILKDAGFNTDNVFIIKDGAKDEDISAAFVK